MIFTPKKTHSQMKMQNLIIRRVLTAFASVFVALFFFKKEEGEHSNSRRCGNVRRNVIASVICGVFAALFPVEDSFAAGAAIRDLRDDPYIVVGYATTDLALAAARAACRAVNSNSYCATAAADYSVVFPDNWVFHAAGNGAYNGIGMDRAAAREVAFGVCVLDSISVPQCNAVVDGSSGTFGQADPFICGDGTESRASDSDICSSPPPPLTCTGQRLDVAMTGCVANCVNDEVQNGDSCDPPVCTDGNRLNVMMDKCIPDCPGEQTENGDSCDPPVCTDGNRLNVMMDKCIPNCRGAQTENGDSCTDPVCTLPETLDTDTRECTCAPNLNIEGVCEVPRDCTKDDFLLNTLTNMCELSSCDPDNSDPEKRTVPVGDICEKTKENDCIGEQTFNRPMNRCELNCRDTFVESADNTICVCPTFTTEESGTCVAEVSQPINTGGGSVSAAPAPNPPKADFVAGAGVVGGGMLAIAAAHYLGGGAGVFGFSPDYGYSISESGYSYNYGGRVDYKSARWDLYWTATQANANGDTGDLRYGSGGSYTADFWTAAFSENISAKTADYDFSLSADYNGGIWKLSPVYRIHSRFEKDGKSETDNALNLEGILRYNRWTISPSAGFRWENAEDFGDNARFGLRAVREF